ncbi:MAG: trypsin-like peptidase domain-containing protein [Deltaproteobacteria bacterium]
MRFVGFLFVSGASILCFSGGSERGAFDEPDAGPAQKRAGASPVEAITSRIKLELNKPADGAAADPDRPTPQAPDTTPDAEKPTATDAPPRDSGARRTAKTVTPKKPTGKGRVKALEIDAQQCQTAEEALVLYRIFIAAPETTAAEKAQVQSRLEFWEQAAKDELVRVGTEWMPKADADKLKEEADNLVAEAIELINVESFAKADSKLERASRIYPDHLESLFLLGVGAFLNRDVKGAEKRFSKSLSRAPNHVPLLNNVALCEALTFQFEKAVRHWALAASLEPDNSAVAQNLGTFIADAGKSAIGTADKRLVDSATQTYMKLVADGKVPRADTQKGYVLLKLFQPKKDDKSSPEESQVVGSGSGFVIWERYVLTNRHVVENADGVVIQDPANPAAKPLGGKVAAVSKELDLAIVQCADLSAPPVPINPAPVSRGTEVLALGFPVMDVVGKGLKATRGIVTGLPSKETGNLMVLDVQMTPGNSGGPLCDKSGRVAGIVAAKTFTERFVQGYGLAVPMGDAVPFIQKTVPDFSVIDSGDEKLEWTEVDGRISKSTVLILIKKKRKP